MQHDLLTLEAASIARTDQAARLYDKANVAAAEAIRWARDPNGVWMARLRQRDARSLRAMARALIHG